MKVNVTEQLLDLDGETIPIQAKARMLAQQVLGLLQQDRVQDARVACEAAIQTEPVTLRRIACDGLLAQFQDEQNLPGDEKVKRMALALRLRASDEVTVSAEEIALLKLLIGKGFAPLIVGRCYALLEGDDAPKSE